MAAIFSSLLVVVIAIVVYVIIIVSDEALLEESEAAIDTDIRMLQEAGMWHDMAYVKQVLTHRIDDPGNRYFYGLKSPDGRLLTGNIAAWPRDVKVIEEGIIHFEVPHEQAGIPHKTGYKWKQHYDVIAKLHLFDDGHVVLVGRDIGNIEVTQWITQGFGALIILIAIALVTGLFFIGKFVVARVNHISGIANDIMQTGNLSARITTESNWDDLSKLASVLNRMLDEIESLMNNTKRVTDNIAHDLRTPLTRLRNMLETIDNTHQRQELLNEADILLSMFNGLLRIADIESAHKKSEFTDIDLAEIAEDATAFYQPLADTKNIDITRTIHPCRMIGDRSLLFQAFANIIDNAVKFTPAGKHIHISLRENAGDIIFAVTDSGAGIAAAEQDHVFRRFYRGDKTRHSQGHGLGLSIVKAVVQLHDGSICFSNHKSGMTVEVTLTKKPHR